MRKLTATARGADPAQARKRDLAAIHLMAAQLGMDTSDKNPLSDYRVMLQAQGGSTSAADLDAAARLRVLAYLRGLTGTSKPRPKDGWQADKIRRLWAELGALGVLNDPTEHGLNAFVSSQTRLAAPRFLPTAQANRVIEALKAWVARAKTKA